NYLHFKGFEVILFNPMITNSKRKSNTLRKTKTDKTDAKVIAIMLLTDNSKSYSPISYQIIELKSLTRFHHRIVNQRGKDKAIELKQLAAKSIGSSNRATAFEIQTTNNLIHVLDKEIKVIDQKIKTIVDEINRFANPSKLLEFSGLDPSLYQFGQYNASPILEWLKEALNTLTSR
ncbi:MAG: transposase, partial [Halanaerobiales bacterium]|nr:transposase [Halanaerobiales bacterium]